MAEWHEVKLQYTAISTGISNECILSGKYQGWDLAEVPDDYVDYMVQQKRKDLQLWEDEQRRRELMREAELSMIEKVIKVGYRTLAQQYHPDHGGDEETMRQLNAAMAQLSEIVTAARDGAYP